MAKRFESLTLGVERATLKPADSLIDIEAKDGREYWLSIPTLHLREGGHRASGYPPDPLMEEQVLRPAVGAEPWLRLGWDRRKAFRLVKGGTSEEIGEPQFLEGKFVAWRPDQQVFIVHHYETTDRENFFLTAYHAHQLEEPLWQIDQKALEAWDLFQFKPKLGCLTTTDQHVFFTIGGFLFKVKLLSGEVVWKRRL